MNHGRVPEATVTAIAELAAEKLSAGQIAERLGLTRNQVIGLCHRRGIMLKRRPGYQNKRPEPAEPRALPVGRRIDMSGCRWPLWGNREAPTHEYCGEAIATPGRPYCAEHERRSRGQGNVDRAAAEGLNDPRARRAGAALDGLTDGEAA